MTTISTIDIASPGASTTYQIGAWGTFEELSNAIRCRTYGHLIRLATPVVEEYHSDLYWDAQWINENVTGPCSFMVLVRTSGTHLGVMAQHAFDSYAPGGVLYRFDITSEDNRVWNLTITEVGRSRS